VKHRMILLVLSAALALAACGESEQDKAKTQVCDARADIQKQIGELQGLNPSTASVDGVTQNLRAIRDDLGKIRDAQGDLNGERKKQVQDANQAFSQQVSSIVSTVGRSLSVSDAESQLRSALAELSSSYKQTLGKVDCG
jgi:Tfp pilus assembly protein PilP